MRSVFENGMEGVFVGLDEETVYLIGFIVDAEFCGLERILQVELDGERGRSQGIVVNNSSVRLYVYYN